MSKSEGFDKRGLPNKNGTTRIAPRNSRFHVQLPNCNGTAGQASNGTGRTALVRALVLKLRFLLLDEPLAD